jgi:CheY-like chemotaxis protein
MGSGSHIDDEAALLATISREIGTPLNALLSMVQTMQADDLPTAQRERLRIVQRSARLLLANLSEVLGLPPIPAKEAPEGLRVLAAEDDEAGRLVLRNLLRRVGVEPTIVTDGRQAVEAWDGDVWDIVLMDIQMPVMDGPAAAREIRTRERHEGRRRTPIIAITAHTLEHQLREYVEAGFDDVVAKPVDAMRLYAALEKALELVQA